MTDGPDPTEQPHPTGVSRRIASAFVDSKLTPLVALFSIALGVFALISTPREKDPTITVPFVQVVVPWPGHSAEEIDERLGRQMSTWVREIPTVEHVFCIASEDAALLQIQFPSGLEDETAITAVNARLAAHSGELPSGVLPPSVTLLGSDDVPALVVAFYGEGVSARELRRVVREVADRAERMPAVASASVIGGSRRTLEVRLDPTRLAAHGLPVENVRQALVGASGEFPVGELSGPEGARTVRTRVRLEGARELGDLVVGATAAGIVRLRDVADVEDTNADPTSYVTHLARSDGLVQRDAVVMSVRKRRGTNAAEVTERVRASLESGELGQLLGERIEYHVAADEGRAATEKVTTLLEHMLIATAVVMLVIGLALGFRAAMIVGMVIPVTLAFVPFVYKLAGFTLNRITLAAMIFAIGILVDDAIVIIENVHRRFSEHPHLERRALVGLTLDAVQEVGSPTILATFTVIAALAPTAFLSGMLGQFLLPLPVGASVAMLFSLFVALTLTPYLSLRILGAASAHGTGDPEGAPRWLRGYARILAFFLGRSGRAAGLALACVLALVAVGGLFVGRIATMKNMPFADVHHMAVVIDMPPATALASTQRAAIDAARAVGGVPEVQAVQAYAGVAGPVTFLGIARGYPSRSAPHQIELGLQLARDRTRTSHEVAGDVRDAVHTALGGLDPRVTIAEEPLGPPTLGALVAEVYAPDDAQRHALAAAVMSAFAASEGVVDVHWTEEPGRPTLMLESEADRLAVHGVVGPLVSLDLRTLLGGARPMELSLDGEPEPVEVSLRLGPSERAGRDDLASLAAVSAAGRAVPLESVARIAEEPGQRVRIRRDGVPVILVTAEMKGHSSPLYPMIDLSRELPRRDGVTRGMSFLFDDTLPESPRGDVRWAGDWTPTYEMNRDLGLAFLVVLFLIYVMLAAWYASYTLPLVVMLPIPLSLVGVVPGHVIMHLPLSGMGTVGVIALAGLMVRNSILIVDFARERAAAGGTLRDAVMQAAKERARPIVLTAATVILGDGVLYFDPMMQGLGLTMASGALVSTGLTLLVVPVAYYWLARVHERLATRIQPPPTAPAIG